MQRRKVLTCTLLSSSLASCVEGTHNPHSAVSSKLHDITIHLTGGSPSPYELNPNFNYPNRHERKKPSREEWRQQQQQQQQQHSPIFDSSYASTRKNNQYSNSVYSERHYRPSSPSSSRTFSYPVEPSKKSKALSVPAVIAFFQTQRRKSPTLYYETLSSILLFVAWQLPACSILLQRHFVCSRNNIIRNKRYHALLLSSLSHASLTHLIMNLCALHMFGTSLRSFVNLKLFTVGAAIFANLLFLASNKRSSCIGLSGVTLAMMALDARLHPNKEIRFVIGRVVPVRMPARHALFTLFAISLFGVLSDGGISGGIAHATHLGGLIFGVLFYEAWKKQLPY